MAISIKETQNKIYEILEAHEKDFVERLKAALNKLNKKNKTITYTSIGGMGVCSFSKNNETLMDHEYNNILKAFDEEWNFFAKEFNYYMTWEIN